MKTLTTFLLLFLLSTCVFGQIEKPLNYSKVKINLAATDIRTIAALGLEVDHGVYAKGKHFINDFSETEIALLAAKGIEYEILIQDVKAWYRERNNPEHNQDDPLKVFQQQNCDGSSTVYNYTTPVNYPTGSMGGYLTYDEMLTTLDNMRDLYPDLITEKQGIGDILTHEGRPIYWITISDNPTEDEGEPEILYDALHHAREPNSMSQLIFYMWYLLENYETNEEVRYLVDNTQMYFVPCVNPDGYVYNELTDPNGGGLWRKNRWIHPQSNAVRGVDLNRNYDYQWGVDNVGSSNNSFDETFRGSAPFSEPETQAIRDFCNEREIRLTLNCHCSGNYLLLPWTYNDGMTEDEETFRAFGKALTKENDFLVGTSTQTIGYTINGGSDDWMYGETESKPKIFSMLPEIGPSEWGFWPPASAIDQINKSTLLQNLTAAHLLLNYAELEEDEIDILTDLEGILPINVKKYGLETGEVTVSIASGSSNLTVDFPPQTINLEHLQVETLPVDYVIDSTNLEEELLFVVHIDNGLWEKVDTITKIFSNISLETAFPTISNDWVVNGEWDTTNLSFYSAPSCITDSHNGNYSNNELSVVTMAESVDLTNATTAFLRFYTKWEIEEIFDYVQIEISTDGINFSSLCGEHTDLIGNESRYHGIQPNWVLEKIDLVDYLGEEITIRFHLYTDGSVTYDGFYFDDFTIQKLDNTTGIVVECLNVSALDTVSVNDTTATFTWEALEGAEEYQFRYKTTIETIWTEVTSAVNTLLIENLSACEMYEAQAKSICGENESDYSESYAFTTDCIETSLFSFNSQDWKIYPNPFNEIFIIEFPTLPINSMNLTVLNQLGEAVHGQKVDMGKQSINVSLANIPKGIYFLKLSNETGQAYYHKIVRL